jgi:hypothetical protein
MAEERLIRVQDHKREWASCEDVREEFLKRFIKRALSCETLQTWERKAFATGNVLVKLKPVSYGKVFRLLVVILKLDLLYINIKPAVLCSKYIFRCVCVFASM